MGHRPTILDVAKRAGVSKSTVSLVLQGSETVKDSTRDAVRQAMADIGYVYNRSAATLRSASSGLIGLVINDIRNPFFTEFAASLQMILADKGFATVLANTNEDARLQTRMIASLIEHGVSGMVISPTYGAEEGTLALLAASGTPTLQVFRALGRGLDHPPFLAPDYERGSRLATQHLLEQGCQRIAFLGGLDGRPVTQERMGGYLNVLSGQGLDPIVLTGAATRSFGRHTVADLIDSGAGVDGILCFNDLVALGGLSACAERGVQVGQDLRMVGFDDIEACRDSFPPLSSVSSGIPQFAQLTAEALLSWITDGTPPPQNRRSDVTLVVRASSGS